MSEEKYVGYKVMFNLGRFMVQVYMTEQYYNVWKYFRDPSITSVTVEEAELRTNQFYNGTYDSH